MRVTRYRSITKHHMLDWKTTARWRGERSSVGCSSTLLLSIDSIHSAQHTHTQTHKQNENMHRLTQNNPLAHMHKPFEPHVLRPLLLEGATARYAVGWYTIKCMRFRFYCLRSDVGGRECTDYIRGILLYCIESNILQSDCRSLKNT